MSGALSSSTKRVTLRLISPRLGRNSRIRCKREANSQLLNAAEKLASKRKRLPRTRPGITDRSIRRSTTMFTSAAAHKHDWRANERRSCSRESLSWIVLVFFGQSNWGKLVDLSEKGMCFQFEQPPSLKEPIEFTFEAMGCMSIPHEANVFGDSFQAAGRVVWTHEFERTAGVQFLNLSQRSRDQIRYWLSSSAEQASAPPKETLVAGHAAGLTEELKREWDAEWNRRTGKQEPETFSSKTPPSKLSKAPVDSHPETAELDLEALDSHLDSVWQPEPTPSPEPPRQSIFHREPEEEFAERSVEPLAFSIDLPQDFEQEFAPQDTAPTAAVGQGFWAAEPEVAAQKGETHSFDAEMVRAGRARERLEQSSIETPAAILPQEERPGRGATLRMRPQRARVGYIVAMTCLGTLLVAAAIIGIATKSTGKAGVGETASLAPLASRVDATPVESGAVESTGPFLVEVLDTSSRRSVLWFTGDSRKDVSTSEVQRPAFSAVSAISRDPIATEGAPASAKQEPLRDFTLVSPHPISEGSPSSAGSEVPTAPTIGEAPLAAD